MESATDYTEQPTEQAADTTNPAGVDVPEDLAALLLGAVDVARAAVEEFSGDTVGEYLGASHEDSTSATHRFLANLPGYRGWQWAVVVAAYPGATRATVSEVVLVPGPTALLAPEWVPWEKRIRPGDLSPGDLLAPPPDDPRLVPGYMVGGDPDENRVAAELGIGRRQVLSLYGRDLAAQRWHDGEFGPDSAMARSTKRACRDCGYLLPLAGSLGTMFGVCANELAADGHVVDFSYGCGAHSDTPQPAGAGSPLYDPYDDGVLDVAENPAPTPEPEPEQQSGPEPETAEEATGQIPETVTEPAEVTEGAEVAETAETAETAEVVEAAESAEVVEVDADEEPTAEEPAAEEPPAEQSVPDESGLSASGAAPGGAALPQED